MLIHRFQKRSSQSERFGGFTLIETMIVIAIVGILGLVSIPNMTRWLSRMRLRGATQNVVSQIDITRKMAITKMSRYCMTFSGDGAYADGDTRSYLIGVQVAEESAPASGFWTTVVTPIELSGFTNNATTDLYRGISLEPGGVSGNTSQIIGTSNCAGLLFNTSGYLDNPASDFLPCNGGQCVKLTLVNKYYNPISERRTVWVNRGGMPRVTSGPTAPPPLAP